MEKGSAGTIAQYGETPASNYRVPVYDSEPGSSLSFFVTFLRSVNSDVPRGGLRVFKIPPQNCTKLNPICENC